ncbi:uncharacterized protein LOC142358515, partial [Convolutriloba macropyga]|uniref:uncharacterized protein LOC142358515 n=1 Tax=Convolutriloba macropyga TaxID=536237 RepID=UPI003F51C247
MSKPPNTSGNYISWTEYGPILVSSQDLVEEKPRTPPRIVENEHAVTVPHIGSPRAIPEIINLGFDWNGSENPGAELDVQKGRSNVSAVEALTAVEGNEQTTSSSPRRQVKRTLGGTGDEQIQNTHYNGVFSHRDFFLTI